MAQIFAKSALLSSGWAKNVRISIEQGLINAIHLQTALYPNDLYVDTLLPALPNLHSHSFQRANAGISEYRTKDHDSFWTWRDLMYRFLDQLPPDDVMAIAAMTFMEMQKAGYGSVGEFHYVHHQPERKPYDDKAELLVRILDAAAETRIGLTHLPVLYSYGSVEETPLSGGQLRFGNKLEQYQQLYESCVHHFGQLPPDAQLSLATHSLRAVSADNLSTLAKEYAEHPLHIHIAEQIKEVEEITAVCGLRPVKWLLQKQNVSPRWCLIYATNITDS